MNKYVNSETTFHLMNLLQMGASVQVVSGKMVYVQFKLKNNMEVSYVYHINKKDKYFLERIKPYPLPIRELETANDVIDLIKIDFKQYTNAAHSHNIKEFVEVNKNLHKTMMALEDLFLYYNVPKTLIDDLNNNIIEIRNKIKDSAKECERVYFTKEPDNL